MIPLYKMFYSKTPKITDKNGIEKPNSIASLEKVNLNGVDQWILIRSHDMDNPILLFYMAVQALQRWLLHINMNAH